MMTNTEGNKAGIYHDVDLTPYNTFGVRAYAEYFAAFASVGGLEAHLQKYRNQHIFILGGGSNILLTKNIEGLTLKNDIRGIEVVAEDEKIIRVRAGAGVIWSEFVTYCVKNGWGGIENLSLIPGSVGATPVQNIGAYGAELKDVFYELEAWHLKANELRKFNAEACHFGYRDSVFKREFKNTFAILNVTVQLSKHPVPNVSYGSIRKQLEKMRVTDLTIAAVSEAVSTIRREKLPDPAVIGNAGSFFKNPVISQSAFKRLKIGFPEIPHFDTGTDVKIPAAWLIEQSGFKGFNSGNVGCYEKQPLVIVNRGGADGSEIFRFSEHIIETVENRFGVRLEREVNVV